jgi:predicted PurR-regulated permease PerM
VDSFIDWFNGLTNSDNEIIQSLETNMMDMVTYLENWVKDSFLPNIQTYITSITSGVINMVKVLMNAVIGIIVSVYVLMTKEKFIGQSKKIVYAIFKPVRGNVIIDTFRKSNEIFGGFISGKLLDSAIIGVLCYICLLIMKMPYTLLVSVFVGLTNIIPFFGPFIGAIPSVIIIALADPIKGIYFLIFIFILQQVDGNIIGPKILGDSTGLNSFWVVFAILVFGGLWGFPGMLLGVPLMAVIYYVAQKLVSYFLRKRGLVDDTGSYIHLMRIDKRTNELVYEEKTEKGTEEKIEESPEK